MATLICEVAIVMSILFEELLDIGGFDRKKEARLVV